MTSLLKLFANKLLNGDIPIKHIVTNLKNGKIVVETMDFQKEIFTALPTEKATPQDFETVKFYVEEIQKLCDKETKS